MLYCLSPHFLPFPPFEVELSPSIGTPLHGHHNTLFLNVYLGRSRRSVGEVRLGWKGLAAPPDRTPY